MVPPPNFPLIEVEFPDFSKWKELEEEFKSQKKQLQAFQAWQEKIEFVLEQNGIILSDSSQPGSPNFKNDSSTEGMKIISITSLSRGSSLKSIVVEDAYATGETIIPHNPTSLNLNESDNDIEIGMSNGVNFRPTSTVGRKHVEDIQGDMNDTGVSVEPHKSTKLHVELPPVDYPNLIEEETEPITESNIGINVQIPGRATRCLRSNSNDRRLDRISISASQKSAIAITNNNSNKSQSFCIVENEPTNVMKEQRKTRYAKDQEEALNHIEEVMSNGKRVFKCKLCSHVNSKDTSVLTHIRMSHIGSERKYPCAYCSYRFKKATHLQQHVLLKHPGQPPCEVPSSLNIVLRREDDTFNIVKSGKRDKSLTSKRNHSIAFSPKSNTRTNGSLTRTQEDLEREIRSSYEIFRDNSVNSYLCIACGFLFDEEAMIRQHIIQTHKCAFCPEIFTSSSQLESHMSFCSTAGTSSSKRVYSLPSSHAITVGPSIQDADSDPPKRRQYSFPEEVRLEVDKYVSNIQNPRPPYICNICHLIIKSTRQSARIHYTSKRILVIIAVSQTLADNFPVVFQPELDNINIDEFLRDNVAMEKQVQCVLHDGPCDAVGRWIKPRVAAAFMGECPMCTPQQTVNIRKIMEYMQTNRPIEYRMAIMQFLLKSGVKAMRS
ncbi:unnamed protein product [Allacma fusca]|uniref:C2H2-type domain-containing protein n=1 Tax=Allacma fusca TaxID=39272 RepID=A0A8J2KKK8_9HEXA|nr:unnamed protein product [Allacma fusca]